MKCHACRISLVLSLVAAFAATWPFRGDWAQHVANGTLNRPLTHLQSWRYVRGGVDAARLAGDPADLLVIDYAGPSGRAPLTAQEIAVLKVSPTGRRRLVVARLSVGAIGRYERAWNPGWTPDPPDWLGEEDCARPGTYRVRYWLSGWRNASYRALGSGLDHIIAAGFDGAYLDRVAAYKAFAGERPSAAREMIDLVIDLARTARHRTPGFLIIAERAEDLLLDPDYRQAIDGVADATALSLASLRLMRREGKPVFAFADEQAVFRAPEAGSTNCVPSM